MTAADTIRLYVARHSPFMMEAPWRSDNPLVRGLWAKQAKWAAEVERDNAAYPSREYDVAFDAVFDADRKWGRTIRDAWQNRAMSRGYTNDNREAHSAGVVVSAVTLARAM